MEESLQKLDESSYTAKYENDGYTVYEITKAKDNAWSVAIIDIQELKKSHYHTKGTEVFTVLEGELEIELGVNTLVLSVGKSVHVPTLTIHKLKSTKKTPVRVLCTNTPAFDPNDLHYC